MAGEMEPLSFTRSASGEFNGEQTRYRAVAGETYLRDENGNPVASLFSTAYLREDLESSADRPVAFIFNGGPGSPSQWLHMGAFGPSRVEVPSEPLNAGGPPYRIVHNTLSLLDVCDLVFVDPIGTGYSHALGERKPNEYWGVQEDARSFADFIQTWITEQRRWNSPKFLIGESYGTARACLVAEILSKRFIALNGIVLIAAVLDYQNSRPRPGDGGILSYASFVPTFAATAWYHGKVDRRGCSLEAFIEEVRGFARTDYALALIANRRLPADEKARVVARLAAYTGLKESYIRQSNLRVPVNRFFKELLREDGVVIGRLDGRYTSVPTESAGDEVESDPTFDAIGNAFTSAIHVQFDALGVRMQRPYVPLRTIDSWNWQIQERTPNGGGYVNVVPHLGRAMRQNKDLRVLVASGYYDLATPFFGAENALSQDGLVHGRISYTYYEVGHMIFVHEPSRGRFLSDVRSFVLGRASSLKSGG